MKIYNTGHSKDYYYKFDSRKEEYDYEHNGLLQKIMSAAVLNTNNLLLRQTLIIFESSLIFIIKYVDKLKNFKNFTAYNR